MKIIGLCGRSGSGKSYVCEIAQHIGFSLIDADRVYSVLMAPSQILHPCKLELIDAFGPEVLLSDGSLNRKYLSNVVFSDPSGKKLSVLNGITHKYILNEIIKALIPLQRRGAEAVILDAPTLFESRLADLCDMILGVVADEETCLQRITARDGLSREEAEKRLSFQISPEEIVRRSDIVIDNDHPTRDMLLTEMMNVYHIVSGGKEIH